MGVICPMLEFIVFRGDLYENGYFTNILEF